MLIQATWKYLFILTISVLLMGNAAPVWAQARSAADTTVVTDTTADEAPKKKIIANGHQLCLGIDILHAVLSNVNTDRPSYELEAHYYLKNEFYGVLEGGWGSSKVDYSDLKYTTTNNFFRLGFNKSILGRDNPHDWDMMFVGFRAGYAAIDRSAGSYTIVDSVWGSTTGSSPAKKFGAYWAELNLGMRVELVKGLMAGWNVRGKFLLNGKSFQTIAPLNIAGYGKGDRNTNFDFNVYLSYAIRWGQRPVVVIAAPKPDNKPAGGPGK